MSISYRGHCRPDVVETQRLVVAARAAHPEWFAGPMRLSDAARPPEPFGAAISREFGIDASSWFSLDVIDKDRFGASLDDAIDHLYAAFAPGDLIITWELDHVRRPRASRPDMP